MSGQPDPKPIKTPKKQRVAVAVWWNCDTRRLLVELRHAPCDPEHRVTETIAPSHSRGLEIGRAPRAGVTERGLSLAQALRLQPGACPPPSRTAPHCGHTRCA